MKRRVFLLGLLCSPVMAKPHPPVDHFLDDIDFTISLEDWPEIIHKEQFSEIMLELAKKVDYCCNINILETKR